MKFLTLVLFIAFSAQAQEIQVGSPIYKKGIVLCEGSLIGAQEIKVLQKHDGTYDLIFNEGNVITAKFNFQNATVTESEKEILFQAGSDKNVTIFLNKEKGQSEIKISITKNEIGTGSSIIIDENSYKCYPLIIAQ